MINVLKKSSPVELVVKNSRFIAELFPISGQAEAREILKAQKTKYFDARHVVHAFVAGPSKEIMGMSDDGEPSGTAGRPVLDVLKGRDCTNVILTVTRYFGGILLGTGGLVHAYGDAAKAVLDKAEFEPLVEKIHFNFSASYTLYDGLKRLFQLEGYHISNLSEDFLSDIQIQGDIFLDESENFKKRIFDFSKGKVLVNLS